MNKRDISQAAKEILESMGLKRGRGRANSVVSRSAANVSTAHIVEPTRKLSCSALPPAGPINRFMYLEAKNWAIDLVASLRGSPVDVVVEQLAGAIEGRPGSDVAGIQSVIEELQAGAGHD